MFRIQLLFYFGHTFVIFNPFVFGPIILLKLARNLNFLRRNFSIGFSVNWHFGQFKFQETVNPGILMQKTRSGFEITRDDPFAPLQEANLDFCLRSDWA